MMRSISEIGVPGFEAYLEVKTIAAPAAAPAVP